MKNFVLYCAILLLSITAHSQSILVNIPSPPEFEGEDLGYNQNSFILNNELYLVYESQFEYNLIKYEQNNLIKISSPVNHNLRSPNSFIIFNNEVYFEFENNLTNNYILFKFDGLTFTEIPSPTGYTDEGRGYTNDYTFIYENNLILRYRHDDGHYNLFKYDGTTLTIVPSPIGYENSGRGYIGSPIIYNSDLYVQFRNNLGAYNLFKYDGDTLTEIPTPPGYSDPGKGYIQNPIVFENKLYLRYQSNNNKYVLLQYDGNTLTDIPSPAGHQNAYKGYIGDAIIAGNDLYMRYQGNDDNYDLFKYDGNTLTEIPSPPGYENSGKGYFRGALLFNNSLYLRYFGNDNNYDLFKYSGDTLTAIPSPPGYENGYRGYSSSVGNIEFNSNLYMRYQKNNSSYNLFKYDGDTLTEIPSPPGYNNTHSGYQNNPIIFENDLFLQFRNNNNNNTLVKYDGDTLTEIPSPLGYENSYRGYEGSPLIFENNLFLAYETNEENVELARYLLATRDTSITACLSYQWIDGNTYTESNYHAIHTLSDASGVDSLIVINLTILYDDTIIQNSVMTYDTTYYYAYNDSTYNQSGRHLIETHNKVNGCDSLIYLDLQLINNPLLNFPSVICQNDSIKLMPQAEDLLSGNGLIGNTYYGSALGVDSLTTRRFKQIDTYSLIDSNALFSYIDISSSENFVSLDDDDITPFLPIGFTFNYWGEEVSQFNIVSNGWISFDQNTEESYSIGLPTDDEDYDNSIFLIDVDLDPEDGGEISYATIGTAPNRIFVVDFDSVSFYSENTVKFSAQLQIYEGSNKIEIHTESADNVSNYENASQGIQSPNDAVAIVVPGRDDSQWVATNDYKAFIPDSVLQIIDTHVFEVVGTDSISDTQTACDSYIFGDSTYTQSGTYIATFDNTNGCDSVVTLNLTINNSNTGIDTQTACDSLTWIDGNTYTASNDSATHTLTNVAGCDSVVTLNLTILSNTVIDTQTACDSFTWIDGNTYTTSNNSATHTLTNVASCDSVVTLNLTINNSNTGIDTQTACDSFTWIDGNTYTASNNSATHTLTNANGCDSVVTLNLTINNSNTGIDTQTACDSFTWIDGNTYTASNNSATHTTTNLAGCDSVVTLNLTILESTSSTFNWTEQDSVVWNSFVFTESIDTSVTIVNAAGCDSVINISLTIVPSTILHNQSFTICNGDSIVVGNSTYTQAGTFIDSLTSANACCDSVVTTTITVSGTLPNPTISRVAILTLETEQNYLSYQWKIDGNDISGANSYQLNISEAGSYNVVVETPEGCQGVSQPFTIGTTDIADVIVSQMSVFPNPTKEKVTLKGQEMGTYKLIDIYGKKIIEGDKTSLRQEIDLSYLADGLYFILFKEKTFQIIKQ